MKSPLLALVISISGDLHNGLLALLTTIPQISAVLAAEEQSSALRLVKIHQPALIILDSNYPELQDVVNKIKSLCSQVHLLILSEDMDSCEEYKQYGADSVLIKGFQAKKLINIIEEIIN